LPGSSDETPPWQVSQASLIRKLEGGIAASQTIEGGTVSRQCRWMPQEQALTIEATAIAAAPQNSSRAS
jgi:hypothetical protein